MKKIISILLSGVFLVSISLTTYAESFMYEDITADNSDNIVSFIVEMEGEPLLETDGAEQIGVDYCQSAEGVLYESTLKSQQNQAINKLNRLRDADIEVGYTYTTLFNGFSVDAPMSMQEELESLPNVKQVYISREMQPDIKSATVQTHSRPEDTYESDENPGYTGAGQVVAIIDTEFQTDHIFFSTPPANPKLTKEDADKVRADAYVSKKIPFAYDYAGSGSTQDVDNAHGTHVAGIVAGANGSYQNSITNEDGTAIGNVCGVAPDAQLVLMKAINANGNFGENYVLAAMEDAISLGVCAINMSFGAPYTSPYIRGGYESALQNASNAGITVNTSAGNGGIGYNETDISTDNPDYSSSGTPNTYSSVTSVASADNIKKVYATGQMTLSDNNIIAYRNAFNTSTFSSDFYNKTMEYVDCGYGQKSDFVGKDVNGKLALIQRGNLPFADKSINAKANGAVGIIMYDPAEFSDTTIELSLPAVFISTSDAQKLIGLSDKTITVTKHISNILTTDPNGGQMSSFSSWGVSESLELKPEITAPGGNIYSSYPSYTSTDTYAYMSGTSMAAPHMSGVTALMCEYLDRNGIVLLGQDKVLRIENMLMSSADILKQPESDIPYSPRLQGAGLVNTSNAVKSPVIIVGDNNKTKLSLGEVNDTLELKFTLKNLSNAPVTYDNISLNLMVDDYSVSGTENIFTGKSRLLNATDDLPDSITIPANGKISLTVNVTPDSTELANQLQIFTNGFFIDGFVVFDNETNPQISIPFTGFYGGWAKMSIFDKTMYDEGGSLLNGSWQIDCYGTYALTTKIKGTTRSYYKTGLSLQNKYDKNRISISPNNDGQGDELAIRLSLMRPAKNMKFTLTNNNGTSSQFTSGLNTPIAKYHSYILNLFSFKGVSEYELPDGDYTLKVAGTFAYDNATEDYFELPVTVDRLKPTITNAVLDGNTLTVTATDNNYIHYIGMSYTDSNGEVKIASKPIVTDKGVTSTAEFNITGIDTDSISVFAEDNAYNLQEVPLDNVSGNIATSLTNYSAESISIFATNNSSQAIKGDAIIALYDDCDRMLTATHIPDISLDIGAYDTYVFNLSDDTSSATLIKMFIWDDITTLTPLDIVKTFTNFK